MTVATTMTIEIKETLHKLDPNFSNISDWKMLSEIYVNDSGDVFKVNRLTHKLQKAGIHKQGNYFSVSVVDTENKHREILVHHIIYSALTGNHIRKGQAIHHRDGNTRNNSLSNLEAVSNSTNVSYFFHNSTGENDSDIANTHLKYSLDRMMNETFWVQLKQYNLEVSNKGGVRRINIKRGKKEANFTSNMKYPTNIIVGYWINGKSSSVSLSRLYALAFYDVPTDGRFKVLIRNDNENLMNPLNYYIAVKK